MTPHRSGRAVPLVPPHRAAEQRNAASYPGTEERNNSGTSNLESLIDRVLSRSRAGTLERNDGGTRPVEAFRAPRNAEDLARCQHVTDPVLAEWYAENPKLTCARCWLEGRR
jgi:hypothetical protein